MYRAFPAFIAASCLVVASSLPAQEAIPDEGLRKVVQEIVQKKTGKPDLTDEALGDIFFLRARGKGIKNLAGMEKMTSLVEVDLAENEIADVGPLKGLSNIQLLDLHKNKIVDPAPLGELKKLQYLQLEHNEIVDIAALANLPAMRSLYLSHNKIVDIAPVGKLEKLNSLYLGHNAIENLGPLGGLKRLDTLNLDGNKVVDLAPLKTIPELRMTLLQRNQITDLAVLVEMAAADKEQRFAPYWQLYLAENPLSDEAKTKQVEALKSHGVRVHLEDPQPAEPKPEE